MSRRDTIIIAVLLNAAVLAILFMMAVNTDDDAIIDQSDISQEILKVEENPPLSETTQGEPIAMGNLPSDEVDRVLNDFTNSSAMEPILPEDESAATVEIQSEKTVSAPITEEKERVPSGRVVDVTVKKGDALERIARANGTTVDAIKKANNLKNERLKIGQVLKVPVGTKKISDAKKSTNNQIASAQTTSSSDEAVYYTIKNGDNPWKIAKQFHVKMDDLLRLNSLDEEKARNLKVGDKIRVK